MKPKHLGVGLVILGILTGLLAITVSQSTDYATLEFAYRNGILMGAAIAECAIGSILTLKFQ